MYARIHWPHGSSKWGMHTRIYGPLLLLYMAHSCPYELYIANAKRLVQIRYKAWRFLIAFLIVLIFVPLNGACMRAYMAIYGRIYGPHGSSIGAYMGAYMGHMGAALGHAWAHTWAIWGSPIGRAGRKGTAGNPFPSLDQGRELPRAYPFPSLPLPLGKGREGKVIPALFRSVYVFSTSNNFE